MVPKVNHDRSYCKVCHQPYSDYLEVPPTLCSTFPYPRIGITSGKIVIVVIFWSYRIVSKIHRIKFNKIVILNYKETHQNKISRWTFNAKSMINRPFYLTR